MPDKMLLCKKCLIADTFFVNGGSQTSDNCPKCGGTECVWFEDLSFIQQAKARALFDKMWKENWNK